MFATQAALLMFSGCLMDTRRVAQASSASDSLLERLGKEMPLDAFRGSDLDDAAVRRFVTALQENCDFDNRRGRRVNTATKKMFGAEDEAYFVYEFFLACDTLRMTLRYALSDPPILKQFAVQPIEDQNSFVFDDTKSILKHPPTGKL